MRCFVTTSMFVSVLLAAAVCLAQDKKPDAAGAKADSPDMWEAYKKMWEGKWETKGTMPADLPGKVVIKNGERYTVPMMDEVILNGHAMLINTTFRLGDSEHVIEQKGLACWCPKQKAVLLYELNDIGERSEGVVKTGNGVEHMTLTNIDAEGLTTTSHTQSTAIDQDTIKGKFLDGPFEGFEITWKRKKN